MDSIHTNTVSRSLSRVQQMREAVLLTFCDPVPAEYMRLLHLSRGDWQHLLYWLDTSGLALYFLDRLRELGLLEMLPLHVLARLQQNLTENSERIDQMIVESIAIQHRFQNAGLSYAVLKGFSLWPISVPKLELRSQLDLDFLVTEQGAVEARRILEDFGYRLNIMSGRTWEFKANEGRISGMKGLYRAGMCRAAELHLEPVGAGHTSLLSRTQKLCFHGVCMPILSPVDLFLGQGLHLYKHLCGEFSRAAHLMEFRRHVIARHGDDVFWSTLQEQVAGDSGIAMRLGIATLLISRVMGKFAPVALTRWTVDQLPPAASLWVDMYGHRMALASFPGSKLYLLLQKELEAAGLPAKRPMQQALLPRRLPPAITHRVAGETLLDSMKRYRRELYFIFFRLHFHTWGGVRFLREQILWRQYKNGLSQ
jgi:hypothetical protein